MEAKDFFNHFYKKALSLSFEKSLLNFFNDNVFGRLPEKELKILDLGGGFYSLFEEIHHFNGHVTSIDFSAEAIKRAPQSKINYLEMNILDSEFFKANHFDLIFDSHCLNCITDQAERDISFKNIYSALSVDGIFASELMIQPGKDSVMMPYKCIKTAMELESEILSHGFKIIYFFISKDCGFTNVVEGVEIQCDLLRVIARK